MAKPHHMPETPEITEAVVPAETPAAAAVVVYSVNIENCLVGERFVATDQGPDAALAKYKAVCGIKTHPRPTVVATDFDPQALPEGIVLFGD